MSLRACFLLLALTFASQPAHALFTPENGFYWTPGQGGTGVAVEVQNQFLFVTGYVYDTAGRPTFVSIQGTLVRTTGDSWLLDTTLFVSTDGRCIGSQAACPFRTPVTTGQGTARVEFLAPNVLVLRWSLASGTQELNLFRFEYATGTELQSLLGEWDVIIDRFQSSGLFLFSGEKLQLAQESGGGLAGCTTALEGSANCSNQRVALTRTSTGSFGFNYVLAVTAADNTVIRRYTFSSIGLGGAFTQTFKGQVTTCTNTTTNVAQCAGSATKFAAYRSASRQYVQTGNGMD